MANIKFTNFARSTLSVGAASGATSLTLAAGTGVRFPALSAGQYFYLTLENSTLVREIVKVTARATDTLTVVRAQDNTTAQTWNAGDVAALRLNALAIEEGFAGAVLATASTGSAILPSGTTAQRDVSPAAGYSRFNSTLTQLEVWFSTTWNKVLTALDLGVTVAGYASVGTFTAAQRGAVTALTDGATITPDFAVANNFSVTLGGNRTLANPTNQTAGQGGSIVITQDGTGSRTLAFGSNWKFPGGTAPTLTTTASAVDVLVYQVESASRITARMVNDVK